MSGCDVSSVSPNAENKRRTNVASREGGVRNSTFDGCKRLVVALNLGKRVQHNLQWML